MRHRLVIFVLVLASALSGYGQMHRIGFGLSAGVHTQFGDSSLTNTWGPTVGLSFRYSCLFHVGSEVWLGPQTGLEAAWTQSGWEQAYSGKLSKTDYLGHQIDYTMSGNITERHDHINVAVPLMAALRYRGIIIGLGFKARAMMWTQYKTSASDIDLSAYYPDFDVTLAGKDAVETYSTEMSASGARKTPEWHVAVAAEAGYEWRIKKHQHLGVLVFVDYGLWNSYSRPTDAPQQSLDVTRIVTEGKLPDFILTPLCSTALNRFHPLSIGLTVTYTFDFESKSHHCNCLPY